MHRAHPTSTVIDDSRIRELIPHAGTMCLLDHVVRFDDTSICCETRSHLDPRNPLRYKGRLSSLCAIEYAAQAMALHGGLKSGALKSGALETSAPRPGAFEASDVRGQPSPPTQARHGFLASIRDTRIRRPYMDDLNCPLTVNAVLEFDDVARVIYAFSVVAGNTPLIDGRAAVVLG